MGIFGDLVSDLASDLGIGVFKARKSGVDLTTNDADTETRFKELFVDPLFDPHRTQIQALAEIQVKAHQEGRKAPSTRKAGPEFKNPDYELSVEWLKARSDIQAAQKEFESASDSFRILIVNGSNRNENTCPGEMSKSARLIEIAKAAFAADSRAEVEVLDLSRVTSEYGRVIHPCKGCLSTAMPLCHWPCSCYPNHSLGQVHDWMNDIYPMWVRAHAILIVTPVYWYQAPSTLKLMIDRLVCADGGNADPTSTHGKTANEAKKIEAEGWDFPKHLKGRFFGTIVHGDAAGVDALQGALNNWMTDLQLEQAGPSSTLGRYIDYMGKYSAGHDALDKDTAIQKEAHRVATALLMALQAVRAGAVVTLQDPSEPEPRPK